MAKIKKLSLVLLGMLFCVTMYGCGAGEKSEQKNNQEAVAAEFAKAIDKYRATTYQHAVQTVEVSDPSICHKDFLTYFGDKLKSLKSEADVIFESRKDSADKVTDYKILKSNQKSTISFFDDLKNKVVEFYTPGDGYGYTKIDNEKSKSKAENHFTSFAYSILTADSVENVTLKTEGTKQIFDFEFKKDLRLTANDGNFVREDSDIELTAFKGTLTIDSSTGLIVCEQIEEFKDKNTGATLKEIEVRESSNKVPELEFPKDLNTYKEV